MDRRDYVLLKGSGHMDDCDKCFFNPDKIEEFRPTDGFYVCDEVEEKLGSCRKGYFKKVKKIELLKVYGNNVILKDGKTKITLCLKDINLPFEWSGQGYIVKDGELKPYFKNEVKNGKN